MLQSIVKIVYINSYNSCYNFLVSGVFNCLHIISKRNIRIAINKSAEDPIPIPMLITIHESDWENTYQSFEIVIFTLKKKARRKLVQVASVWRRVI